MSVAGRARLRPSRYGARDASSGRLTRRFALPVVPIALAASIVSTAALAVVLFRAFGPLSPSLPTHWTVRTEEDERVIAGGHDEEILALVVHGADEEIPKSDRPAIASIQAEGGRIQITFAGQPNERLTIRAAQSSSDAFLRTDAIAVSWSGRNVPETIGRYVAVIAKSPVWGHLWTLPARGGPQSNPPVVAEPRSQPSDSGAPQPARRAEHPLIKESGSAQARISERSVWLMVLWALIAGNIVATVLLLVGWRQSPLHDPRVVGPFDLLPGSRRMSWRARLRARRIRGPTIVFGAEGPAPSILGPRGPTTDPGRVDAQSARLGLVVAATAIMALGVAVLAIAHFHFRIDDYAFLALATRYPAEITGETRILSTRAHYQLGVLLGSGGVWFAASNLALLGAMCTCWGLLLRRIGFSRDAAVVAVALLAMGPGTFFLLRQANGIEHLSATTCLMLVVLLTDLAARDAERPRAWRYGVLVLALCLSVLGVLMKAPLMVVLPPSCWLWGRWLVSRPAPPMHRSATYVAYVAAVGGPMFALTRSAPSLGFLPSRWALAALGDRLSRYAIVTLLLLALGARLSGAGRTLMTRAGRLPVIVWALALSALWMVPFVLHAEYEGEAHYGMLASAPLSAVAAWLIAHATEQRRDLGWRTLVGACIACAILLPLGEIRAEVRRSATEFLPAWLDQVRVLTAAQSPPERIVVAPACSATFTPTLSQQMNDVYSEIGIWWATGWYDVPVEFHDEIVAAGSSAANVVTLGYCPGRRATVETGGRTDE